eukprot:TRINITY_DN12704_c0_g1_i1.p1 TRINITY_DN12704_c0_g1~~TRINITY_DN12704_c0_g1_i1.p1  ORF type:complete len:529 (-),score=125.67 TRINITY_DN12704_c0_g1_i1:3-1562(-)
MFAVGSFNSLCLCDKTGWTYSRERTDSGSLFNLAWTTDGTQVAGAGGNGAVILGNLVERKLEWQSIVVTTDEDNHIHIQDVTTEQIEEHACRDRLIKISLAYDYLVAATTTQLQVFNVATWNSPIAVDIKESVNLIVQAEKHFLTVDNFSGIQIYNYEGRLLLSPKIGGVLMEFLNEQTIAVSNDFLAVVDRKDRKTIHRFEISTGRPLENKIVHSLDIIQLCLNQYSNSNQRKVAFIDKNHDLYISPVNKIKVTKMGLMVNSARWSDKTDMLAAVSDGKFLVWLYPNSVFFDKALTTATRSMRDASTELGTNPQIVDFFGKTCVVRRTDGALISFSVTPYPLMLYAFEEKGDWNSSIRLCRFVKDHTLWACLAAMAVDSNDLNTAEVAFAAVEEVDKLQFIARITEKIPSVEGRTAELYLFKGQQKEAEQLFLQSGLHWRAIKMNIRLHKWERALELGIKYNRVAAVVGYRQRYLESAKKEEKLKDFIRENSKVTVNWDEIKLQVKQDKDMEANRGNY